LELAKTSQLVEVTAEVPLVQTATSDLAYQVEPRPSRTQRWSDRDIFDVLPFMAPSVTRGWTWLRLPAEPGSRHFVMLNGAEDKQQLSAGAININPPLESVEDFSILTNSMGAQYGRGAGALVSANQKSGTNKFTARSTNKTAMPR